MAYINVPEGVPGIRSLVMFRPETGKYLYELAQVLLRGPSPLTEAEREMIAAYVSNGNNCSFCMNSHAAAARCLLGDEKMLMDDVLTDPGTAGVSEKMKALLDIAGKVRVSGKEVDQDDIDKAEKGRRRRHGYSRHGIDRCNILHVQQVCRWIKQPDT